MRPWKFLLPLLATSVCFAAQPDRIAGAINSSSTFALPGSHNPKAQPEFDQGMVDPSLQLTSITMVTVPSPAQEQALDLLLAQQQIPRSPKYHKWLTPAQFGSQFGLSQNDLNKITGWLKSEGFAIQSVSASRNSIVFSGTAGQVEGAFGTEIHNYLVDGKKHIANATPVLLPSALNGIVAGVMGLHNFLPHPTNRFGNLRKSGARPQYAYTNSNGTFEFLAPGDVVTNYDIAPLYSASINGTGEKLAIIGQTDVYLEDINNFRSGFNLNQISGCSTNGSGIVTSTSCSTTYFSYVLPTGTSDPGVTYPCGDLGESDLDIEWSGAIAQLAQVIFVNSPVTYDSNCNPTNSQGVNTALIYAIQQNLAPVMSMSYGICELFGDTSGLDPILKEGATQGITVLNSSDDIASAGCDFNPPNADPPFDGAVGGLAVSYPASSAYVTGVGGTEVSLADDFSTETTYWGTTNSASGGSLLTYIPEIAWNDDVELAEYCAGETSNTFCTNDNGDGGAGWKNLNGAGGTAQNVQADIWLSGGGGGASNCFTNNGTVCSAGVPQPTWQSVTVSGAPTGVRYVPDVSLMASPNFPGYIFCTQLSELGDSGTGSSCSTGGSAGITYDLGLTEPGIVGGTSVSSPVFAAIITLMNQYLNGASSTGLGLINPMLYTLAATPSNNAFHRITSGDNNVYCQAGQPSIQPTALQCPAAGVMGYSASNSDSKTGYNLVDGLGSVDANNLAAAWKAALAPQFTLTVTPPTTASVSAGSSTTFSISVAPIGGATPTVNFTPSSCSNLPSGASCSFSPASVTLNGSASQPVMVTIATAANMVLASGTTITIAPTGSSITTTVTLTVTATNQSFTIAPANSTTTYSVAAGSAATVNIAVSGQNGFVTSGNTTALPLTYTCPTGLPSEATCNFSPSSGTGVSATSLTLSISTTAPTSELRRPFDRGSRIFYAMLLPGVFGIVFAAGSRGRGARLLGLIVVLGLSTLWLGACGGSSSSSSQNNPGTPAGSYTVTVKATTGAPTGGNALTSSFNITLTVTN